eukprot:1028489-Prorocentrum_minimum.AAC.1
MDRKLKKELKERMGGVAAPVPRVFIGNTYLGGYEEVIEMNELEELKELLEVSPEKRSLQGATVGSLQGL